MATTQPPTTSATHSLLSDSTRRHLLALLEDDDGMTVSELATRIVAREHDVRPENVDEKTRDRVVVALIHKHLPMLEEHDVIRYDRNRDTVALRGVFDERSPREESGDVTAVLQALLPRQ